MTSNEPRDVDWDAELARLAVEAEDAATVEPPQITDADLVGFDLPDRESVAVEESVLGPDVDPVDSPDVPAAARWREPKTPAVPAWLRTVEGWKTMARLWFRHAKYVATYHAVRLPKYALKVALWAPVGAGKTMARFIRWASAEEGNYALRQGAANHDDAETWLKLDKQRMRQSKWRWLIVIATVFAAAVATLVASAGLVPQVYLWVAGAVAVLVSARLGRPADKPITDRVSSGPKYRKLTAELVRRALTRMGVSAITQAVAKDPAALSFPQEIRRDGPGYQAIVDLPFGVAAGEILKHRPRLASGLRLPVDQVWPQPGGGHAGRLEIWVGDEPASQMKQPAWPLLHNGKHDVFKPFPFATTPRLATVNGSLIARNYLFGGVMGSGKSFAMRVPIMAASLDARVELMGYELKGTGDYDMFEDLCTRFGSGNNDATAIAAIDLLEWLMGECQKRGPIIKKMAAAGKAPENKVTPELASKKGLGLHPIVAWIDEVQELFAHPDKEIRKASRELAPRVVKLARALGIVLLLGTQRPDAPSMPTTLTSQVNTRCCLAVMDQQANDMILGTSAYKNGWQATQFEPEVDAGWMWTVGLGKPAPMRGFNVDNPGAKRVAERAKKLRQGAGTLPSGDQEATVKPGYDLLGDVWAIWPDGVASMWNADLVTRLAELRPEVYTGWKAEQLTASLKPHGVTVGDIGRRIDGKATTRRGIRRDDLQTAITQHNEKRREG